MCNRNLAELVKAHNALREDLERLQEENAALREGQETLVTELAHLQQVVDALCEGRAAAPPGAAGPRGVEGEDRAMRADGCTCAEVRASARDHGHDMPADWRCIACRRYADLAARGISVRPCYCGAMTEYPTGSRPPASCGHENEIW